MREGAIDVVDLASKLPIPLRAGDLEQLHYAINLFRITSPVEDALSFHFDALRGASQRVEKSLGVLKEDLPKLIRHHREFDSERAAETAELLETVISVVEGYCNERWTTWGGKTPSRRHEPWHADAIYLHCLLDGGARQTGEALKFSYATAPAVSFIDEALKRAKVKHGSREAIARFLARYETETERQLKSMLEKRSAISAT
jgi:hypothetical protein